MKIEIPDVVIKREGRNVSCLRDALFHMVNQHELRHEDCAKILGLSRTAITNMNIGKQAISIEQVEMLANHFGMEIKLEFVKKEVI